MAFALILLPPSDAITRARAILMPRDARVDLSIVERASAAFAMLEPVFVEYSKLCGAGHSRHSPVKRQPPICYQVIQAACLDAEGYCQALGVYAVILAFGDFPVAVRAALRIAQIHAIARNATMCIRLPKDLGVDQLNIYRAELDSLSLPSAEVAESLLADIDRAADGSADQRLLHAETAAARTTLLLLTRKVFDGRSSELRDGHQEPERRPSRSDGHRLG